MGGSLHIGLSGFAYKGWMGEGRFYPPKTKASDYLRYYGTRFATVEGDGTWYRVPSEEAIASWMEATPAGFQFCPKMHRKVTHLARLMEEGDDLLKFILDRLAPLAQHGKLGPILVQLPPNLALKDDRLAAWLARTPFQIPSTGDPVRYAFEFRNDSWKNDAVLQTLHQYGVAWVASDTDESEAELYATAPFQYVRLRKSDYDAAALDAWADRFRRELAAGRDLFVFCKHEDDGSPWIWADGLKERLG